MDLPADSLDSIGKLSAPVFFAIGNHERYVGSDAVCARLEALGVTVLRNAAVDRGTLRIMGIDDAETRNQVARQLARIEVADHRPAAYTVLMYHRPDGVRAAARAGVDLMLCGHTHNGQIMPFNWMVKRFFPFIAGRFDIGDMALYVSPGTGTWGPTLRLGSVNEITLFELTPEAGGGRRGPPEANRHGVRDPIEGRTAYPRSPDDEAVPASRCGRPGRRYRCDCTLRISSGQRLLM